jgi:hypothetical protein
LRLGVHEARAVVVECKPDIALRGDKTNICDFTDMAKSGAETAKTLAEVPENKNRRPG